MFEPEASGGDDWVRGIHVGDILGADLGFGVAAKSRQSGVGAKINQLRVKAVLPAQAKEGDLRLD